MADHRNKKKPVNDRLWVRVLCGILGILMILGTFVYVLASFQLNAADEVRVNEREIAVGIAYGNDLLPTYTVTADGGFSVGIAVSAPLS